MVKKHEVMRGSAGAVFSTVLPTVVGLALWAVLGAVNSPDPVGPEDREPSQQEAEFFAAKVLPLLETKCFKCHGGRKRIKGGLRLTTRGGAVLGGDVGPAIDTGNLEKSRLLEMISYKDDDHQMPPEGKLPDAAIATLTQWVRMGAPYPGVAEEPVVEEAGSGAPENGDWWAYRPLERPAAPDVERKDWVKSPIDAFILAKLEQKGLGPSPPAQKVALIRRVYYDLTGLPPTPEEIDAFLADPSPDAYEELVDRLLESPRYGEKWGRHWLDLVRFAETHGYERDSPKPHAWRYRDYVISSFNDDKPYDRFLQEQIAGDELDDVSAESVTATGFYRLGIWNDEPADRKLAKYDVLDGILATTSQVAMAMTIGCARCHDHKKDPIPQEDYYRMLAFFQDVSDMRDGAERELLDDEQVKEVAERRWKKESEEARLYSEIFALQEGFKAAAKKHDDVVVETTSSSDIVDLHYRFYRDTWEALPEFDILKHEAAGRLTHNYFTLEPASRKHAIGLVFDGKLRVPREGEYEFFLESSEGARLLIDGKKVLEKDGKGRQQGSATASLRAGLLPVRLEYFNSYSQPELSLEWSGVDLRRRSLSAASVESGRVEIVGDARSREPQKWLWTRRNPGGGWMKQDFKPQKHWKEARGGFGTRGTPGSIVHTTWKNREIWLLREFELTRRPSQVFLDIHHDEDAEVFLNGQSVQKLSGHRSDYLHIELDAKARAALRVGRNVIAVYCRQTGGGQYIDVGLSGGFEVGIVDLIREHGERVIGQEKAARYADLVRRLSESRKRTIDDAEAKYKALVVAERGRSKTHVFVRGSPHSVGKEVEPGFPAVFGGKAPVIPEAPKDARTSGKRRIFAQWLVSDENFLTPRAIANRLWQFHFGRGITPSSNDFGRQGELPTHPDLLDWLACEVRARGWRLKAMHKLLLLSNTYRMASLDNDKGLALDPENNLYWRFDMRRLTAEEIRDSILSVRGTLNLKMGGPSFYPEVSPHVLQTASRPRSVWGRSSVEEQNRRSVYIFIKRSLVPPMLAAHDLADTDSSCAVRFTTTVPTQALTMLNSKFLNDSAAVFAERLRTEAGDQVARQVGRALRLVCGRPVRDAEVARGVALIEDFRKEGVPDSEALKYFCLMALNLNEFAYLD